MKMTDASVCFLPERGFVILNYIGNTPSMAMCKGCGMKFFVPMPLKDDPVESEKHLREKYSDHSCTLELLYKRRRTA